MSLACRAAPSTQAVLRFRRAFLLLGGLLRSNASATPDGTSCHCYALLMKSPFTELGLSKELAQVLTGLGYEERPRSRPGDSAAARGTRSARPGCHWHRQTGAFALPLLQRVLARTQDCASGSAGAGTERELAIQVAEALHSYGAKLGAVVLPIYGGRNSAPGPGAQARRTCGRRNAGTRARHIRRGTLNMVGSLTWCWTKRRDARYGLARTSS